MTDNVTPYTAEALLRAIEEGRARNKELTPNGWRWTVQQVLDRAAELTRAMPATEGWRPIDSCPIHELVLLRNAYRNRSDSILGCVKDIGYLHPDGWFSTFSEHRAMSKEAFTHWSPYNLPEPPHED